MPENEKPPAMRVDIYSCHHRDFLWEISRYIALNACGENSCGIAYVMSFSSCNQRDVLANIALFPMYKFAIVMNFLLV